MPSAEFLSDFGVKENRKIIIKILTPVNCFGFITRFNFSSLTSWALHYFVLMQLHYGNELAVIGFMTPIMP